MFKSLISLLVLAAGLKAYADTDCKQVVGALQEFQLKNMRNQDANLNFIQQISGKLRDLSAEDQKILKDATAKMADDTDTVLNAAYDNKEKINADLDTLLQQVRDCIAKIP